MSDYCDTSLIVSLYIQDEFSARADQIVQQCVRIFFTPLHQAEWQHAVAQNVFRKRISAIDADGFIADFARDITATRWSRVAMPESSIDLCGALALQHGRDIGMRALDSLHVACALELGAKHFWTFDERQAKLAKATGLKTA